MKTLSYPTQLSLFEAMLDGSRVATSVTDPELQDNPLIYTNRTFEALTGYSREEVLGRNCRFLQGKDTDPMVIKEIKRAIEIRKSVTVTLKNYRKDGSPFWNRLNIEPVTVEDRLYFIGTQTDVSTEYLHRQVLAEKDEEINRLLLPILSISETMGAVTLVGEMTRERFEVLTSKLSEYVQKNRSRHIIIDISGVFWEQGYFSSRLLMIQGVLRLMGTKLYVTGISPKAAIEIAEMREPTKALLTFATVQSAIEFSQR
ncbi:PAS domain-containing protein [Planomicrobium sp. CPCC 101079]|uniref:PAS domain-containing protein n=1 Tax=Planomicrobium sp. CPCC 101079 TaxID=2599618 RepID=UPI0011B5F0B3|nr:STAS domain-containing protein [Planomicrobium sp. CPCC 101079]TWT00550.1 PAS domain-containing protein [Planomicrobium sp. CPCC 101079]